MQGTSEKLRLLLPDEILTVFTEKLGFKQFTPVQQASNLICDPLNEVRIDMSFSDCWVIECRIMREHSDYRWGDYYLSGGHKGKKSWVLELIHTVNQMIPTFNELFDEETFYVFAFIVVISSFFIAFFLAKVVGIRIREYPLNINREWRDARPANPFRFPWNRNS